MDSPNASVVGETITRVRHCSACSRELIGLEPEAACPECGAPARESSNPAAQKIDQRWLAKLQWAIGLKLLTVGGVVIGTCAALLTLGKIDNLAEKITYARVALTVLSVAGAMLLTWPEPRRARGERRISLRRVVRVGTIISGAAALENAPFAYREPVFLVILGIVLMVGALVRYFGEFVYLRRLALRLEDYRLAADTRTLMWAWCVLAAMAVLTTIAVWSTGSRPPMVRPAAPGNLMAGTGVLVCAALAAAFALCLWYVSVMIRYWLLFRAARMEARRDAVAD